MVAISAMSVPGAKRVRRGVHLELALDGREKLRVTRRIDLALQDAPGARHRKIGHLVAQLLASARDFLLDLRLGSGHDARGFGFGLILGSLDRLRLELLALRDDLGRAAL